jgi:hypothetical protein
MQRVRLTLRTLPFLRWRQLAYRPVRRLQALFPARRLGREPAWRGPLLLRALLEEGPGDAAVRVAAAERVLAGEFEFLDRAERLTRPDWRQRYVSHLWSFHLHYFGYAIDLAWAARLTGRNEFADRLMDLVDSWIGRTEPGRGDGWQPYPTAVRLDHWLRALALLEGRIPPARRAHVLRSVAAQASFLQRRLEFHLLGNHLEKNYYGLAVAGRFCGGAVAEGWRRRGLRGLEQELHEQVLPDGAHYERSASYHALVLADALRIIALLRAAGEAVPPVIESAARRMLAAAGVLLRPDGPVHRFNDAAEGMGPERGELNALASAASLPHIPAPDGVLALPDAGYYGFAEPDRTRLLVDGGPLGPEYQPAHGHCDLLSFEFDLAGTPLVVDSGTHGYDEDPFREYARSTRAHNTIMLAGREQSELWGTFRAARRAALLGAQAGCAEGAYRFEGAYRPYYSGRISHMRRIEWRERTLRVEDRVAGTAGAAASYIHLHPEWSVEMDGLRAIARRGGLAVAIDTFGGDTLNVVCGQRDPVQGWFFPRFGVAQPAACLVLGVSRAEAGAFGYRISPLVHGAR